MNKHRFLILIFILSLVPILESAYLPINGEHVWRQGDVYASILGFSSRSEIPRHQDFFGRRVVYDIPVYSAVVAKVAEGIDLPPLVVARYFNAILWTLLLLSGWSLARAFVGELGAAIFVFVASLCPLFAHYFSTPLPDVLATSLSMFVLSMTLGKNNIQLSFRTVLAAVFLGVAALIKSPIPFVFLIFYGVMRLFDLKENPNCRKIIIGEVMILGAAAFASAVGAELIRKAIIGVEQGAFAQDPSWYFGTFELRASKQFLVVLVDRMKDFGIPSVVPFIVVSVFGWRTGNQIVRRVLVASVAALFAGWFTFSNVYFRHNYYQIPVAVLIIFGFSLALGAILESFPALLERLKRTQWIFAVLFICFIGVKISQARMSQKVNLDVFEIANIAMAGTEEKLLIVGASEPSNPAIPARVGHAAAAMDRNSFEKDCPTESFKFILIMNNTSECALKLKPLSKIYYSSPDAIFMSL